MAIIDDHALFAEALSLTLEMEGYAVKRIDPTSQGGSLAGVLSVVLRSMPRVVLLDLDLGKIGDGTRLIEPLTKAGIIVVVMTGNGDHSRWGECLGRGAVKVLPKAAPLNEVVATLRRIRDGLPVMPRQERRELIDEWHRDLHDVRLIRERLARLTPREQEILGELMLGHQVSDIARRSVVSEATVRTQVKAILAKLETSSQLGAVGAAYRVGWHVPVST